MGGGWWERGDGEEKQIRRCPEDPGNEETHL
jgi:hypothetical protein